jgi:hypothetical protein
MLNTMGKKELIVKLKKRGQAIGGKKGNLYNRLQKALNAKVGVAKPGQLRATKKKKTMLTPGPDNIFKKKVNQTRHSFGSTNCRR